MIGETLLRLDFSKTLSRTFFIFIIDLGVPTVVSWKVGYVVLVVTSENMFGSKELEIF